MHLDATDKIRCLTQRIKNWCTPSTISLPIQFAEHFPAAVRIIQLLGETLTHKFLGSDGGIHFWDGDARLRIKCTPPPCSIPESALLLTTHHFSLRNATQPYLDHSFQSHWEHLCVCGLVRLVERTYRKDRSCSKQDYAALLQGRRGQKACFKKMIDLYILSRTHGRSQVRVTLFS